MLSTHYLICGKFAAVCRNISILCPAYHYKLEMTMGMGFPMGMGIGEKSGNGNGREWETTCMGMGMAIIPMGINSHRRIQLCNSTVY